MNVWTLISLIEGIGLLIFVWYSWKLEKTLAKAQTAIKDYNDRLGREYGQED